MFIYTGVHDRSDNGVTADAGNFRYSVEIATAGETAALAEWIKYRVLLMRVDTSKAPVIEWPTQPDSQAS